MRTRYFAILALVAIVGLFTATLAADRGHGNGKGNPHAVGVGHDDRWEHHDRYDVRIFDVHEGRPPGWSHGNKTGWGNCGLPPGQAKKYSCRTYVHEGCRYYYYQDDVGRIVVRRPRIDIHAVIQ